MVELQNDFLNVVISEKGAEFKSIKTKDGREMLWNGDKNIWSGQAPVMFPICGGLKDDKFEYNGKEYTLTKHGFAKLLDFEVIENNGSKASFLLSSNEQTLKSYPFEFDFIITYTLKDRAIDVKYEVKNKTEGPMFFSVGSHEAYACPEGIEEYSIVFEKDNNLSSNVLHGNLLGNDTIEILKNSNELKLEQKYFAVDALVFKNLKSRSVYLKHMKNGNKIKVDFHGFDNLLLWTKPNAPYICIEPWNGIPDTVGSSFDFTKKEGITKLDKGGVFERTHTITVL